MAGEPTCLPKDLENINDLLVFLRHILYGRPLSGKNSTRSTTWKLVRTALLWSDFHPLVLDLVTTEHGFRETRFDYDPRWEPALRPKGAHPPVFRRLSYSKILREVWPSYRGGPKVAAPESAQAELRQALTDWEVKNAFLVRTPWEGTWPPPWALSRISWGEGSCKMPQTNTPCLFLRGRLILPSWGV